MPIFRSRRERRLWLWVLAVVAAIFSTLGLAGVLVDVLGERRLLEAALFAGMIALVGATVLAQGVRARPRGVEVALWLGLAAVYLLVLLRLTLAERSHLIEFGVLGVLVYEALSERKSQGGRVVAPPLLAILATAALGLLDEGVQAVIPSRVFDPTDMLFNALAGAFAVGASVALSWVRRRVGQTSGQG